MICADRTQPAIAAALHAGGAELIIIPSGGAFGPVRNDHYLQSRSRETGLPIVFVHPAEFLVTGPGGAILACTLVGDRLLVQPDEVGGEHDQSRVFWYDVPVTRAADTAPATAPVAVAARA